MQKEAVFVPHEFIIPPATAQERLVQCSNHTSQRIALHLLCCRHFFLSYFLCGFLPPETAHCFLLLSKYFLMVKAKIKELLPPTKTKQKDGHSNHHHRSLMPEKNWRKLNNIMWHYSIFSPIAYASIQPHKKSYNNIMLNSQHNSSPQKQFVVY